MKLLIHQIRTEFLLESRSWAQSAALVLLVAVIVYVVSRIHPDMGVTEFNFIYWVLMMLISINVAVRGNGHRSAEEHLLIYTLIRSGTAFLARFIFNWIYLMVIGLGMYLAFLILYYPQVEFERSFVGLILLGSSGITAALSFVSAIVSHLPGQNTILGVLSIPVLIPVIIVLYNMGMSFFMQGSIANNQYLVLISISLLSLAVSIVLFPIVWKE